ncbi:MAG: CDP-alcohol phosphatidyltransferase family protein [Deltaproteobacteria bacterium]|nr:CDP-alcohol phosphatidyltransferase family protein [Deltaproteobacteria bacterium]MBW2070200.1 CDP-alcohol phosphatidyltransferase family protein [Deltaproteobacteria bacterium]
MLKGSTLETVYYRFLGKYLVPCCVFLRLKPNHVTIFGALSGLAAGICFVFSPLWGGALTLLTGLLDTLDGALARQLGQEERRGAFMDSVLDRYTELCILGGIWAYFYRVGGATPLMTVTIVLVLFGSLMVSYTRARAEALRVSCMVGLFQRGERIIAIGVTGMVNSIVNLTARANEAAVLGQDAVLIVVLILLAVGTNLTALWRFFHVCNQLRS